MHKWGERTLSDLLIYRNSFSQKRAKEIITFPIKSRSRVYANWSQTQQILQFFRSRNSLWKIFQKIIMNLWAFPIPACWRIYKHPRWQDRYFPPASCQPWCIFNPFIFYLSQTPLIAFKVKLLLMVSLHFILVLPFQPLLFTYHQETSTVSLPVACIHKAQLTWLSEEVYFSLKSRHIGEGRWRSRSQFLKNVIRQKMVILHCTCRLN